MVTQAGVCMWCVVMCNVRLDFLGKFTKNKHLPLEERFWPWNLSLS